MSSSSSNCDGAVEKIAWTAPGRNAPDYEKGPKDTNARRRFIYDVALMTIR